MKNTILFFATFCFCFVAVYAGVAQRPNKQRAPQQEASEPQQSTKGNVTTTQVITDMTPERIQEAIDYGRKKGAFEYAEWTDVGGLFIRTPFLRVASAASLAKADKPFTQADVTKEMTRPVLDVLMSGTCSKYFSIEYSGVLVATGKEPNVKIVKPLSQEVVSTDCEGKQIRSVKATFPLSVLAEGNVFRFEMAGFGFPEVVMKKEVLDHIR